MNHRTPLLLLLGLLASCAQLPDRPELPVGTAPAPATQGVLAERIQPAEASHPGQSGFHLVSHGPEAYTLRAQSARHAVSSLDVQTYIWHADLTGMRLAQAALAAADRGVKVRLLVDDFDARAKNAGFAALDAHPNIEVRLFNPFASRSGGISRAGELGTSFSRLNHRMHNKSWIADNRIALVGGRNLGDEYFGASEGTNFVDLDLAMIGPVVQQVSQNFDRFWNAPSNYPIEVLDPAGVTPEALQKLRPVLQGSLQAIDASPYAQTLAEDEDVQRLIAGDTRMHWTQEWHFVSDDPLKLTIKEKSDRSEVAAILLPAMREAKLRLRVISPYFVPGELGTQLLVDSAAAGVDVNVLTNSLAANDVAAVHGGYSRYREQLLDGGVKLWELKPSGDAVSNFSLKGSTGSSLHTKAMVLDDDRIFVGSYNLDPRSTSLNSEQGLLVRSAVLADELGAIFATQLGGEHAWKVEKLDGKLQWSDGKDSWDRDPEAGASRRFQAWLMRILPVQSQL